MVKVWKPMMTFQSADYIQLKDVGMEEWYNDNKLIEKDDLRWAIELNGGFCVVFDFNCRCIIKENGDIEVQQLA